MGTPWKPSSYRASPAQDNKDDPFIDHTIEEFEEPDVPRPLPLLITKVKSPTHSLSTARRRISESSPAVFRKIASKSVVKLRAQSSKSLQPQFDKMYSNANSNRELELRPRKAQEEGKVPKKFTILPDFNRLQDIGGTNCYYLTPEQTFDIALLDTPPEVTSTCRLLNLESKIRRLICSFIFEHDPDSKKVALAPYFLLKDAFACKQEDITQNPGESENDFKKRYEENEKIDPHFATVDDVLRPADAYAESATLCKDDVLAYFWSTYKFHMTLSTFTGSNVCPLSHGWFPKYYNCFQNLTVEIDLTRFGFGAGKHAGKNLGVSKKLEKALDDLISGLEKRTHPINQLHVMVRRYVGSRPEDHSYKPQDRPGENMGPSSLLLVLICGFSSWKIN